MTFNKAPPADEAIRASLAKHLPNLTEAPLQFLGEGWAFNAFAAGDTVLRFPKLARFTETLAAEAAIMQELAPQLPLAVSAIQVHLDGPDGLPYTSHRLVPGVPARELLRPLAAEAGGILGRFLRVLHDYPVGRAAELGLHTTTIGDLRDQRSALYDNVRDRVLSLVDATTNAYVRQTFEAMLGDPATFDFGPTLIHADIDGRNTLADPATGELTGVIDWGDMTVGDPALDFTDLVLGTMWKVGLCDQMPALLAAYGIDEGQLSRMMPRCHFFEFLWPIHEIVFALDNDNHPDLAQGIEWLEKEAREAAS